MTIAKVNSGFLGFRAGVAKRVLTSTINMVSIVVMARGALVNALAFSGTNYLFGKLGGVERKWHNLAMEQLSKDHAKYSKKNSKVSRFESKNTPSERLPILKSQWKNIRGSLVESCRS